MYCKQCGAQLSDQAVICVKCGVPTGVGNVPVPPPLPAGSSDQAMRFILPIGRSGYAIAAGYLALFSILLLPAPLALLFGILALGDIKKHPDKTGKGRAWFGIVMGGLCSLLLVMILIGSLIAK